MDEKVIEEINEHSKSGSAASKEQIEEDNGVDNKIREAQESNGAEKVDSDLGSLSEDGKEISSAASKVVVEEDGEHKEGEKISDTENADHLPQDGNEITSGDDSFISCNEGDAASSSDHSTTATGFEEVLSDQIAEFPTSYECGEKSGTGDEIEADSGARPKEIKGILAVKLKTPKKNIQSAIPEVRPENIGLLPKKKNIVLNVSEKEPEREDKINGVAKKYRIDFDPVMTARFCSYDSRDEDKNQEPELTSPGRELLGDLECRLKEETSFTPKRGDQLRSSFRHHQTVSRIAETREWSLGSDDARYGVHRTYSDAPPRVSCWTKFKNNVVGCLCCCCMSSTCCREDVHNDKKEAPQTEERKGNGEITPAEQKIEDINVSLNDNANTEAESKPKRIGRMKRIRRFFRRLFCCIGCREN